MAEKMFAVEACTSEEMLSGISSHLSDKARGLWLYLEKERKERGIPGLESILRSQMEQLKEKATRELNVARKELGG